MIPSREEAIFKLVEADVRRWGEGERAASQRLRGSLSHGRAVNALAHVDVDHVDDDLAAMALQIMTASDWRELRQ
jgi:hypothetical protein